MNPSTSTHVRPGAQPFEIGAGPVGLVIIHGLGGSPFEYRDFAAHFSPTQFSLFGPRLAGHGLDEATLAASNPTDWQASVAEAIVLARSRCRHVFLLGASYGAVLALQAAKGDSHISGLILVNPALSFRGGGAWQDLALRVARVFMKNIKKSGLSAADRERYKYTGSLAAWPITTIQASKQYVRQVVMPTLADVTSPLLVLSSTGDTYVDVQDAKAAFETAQLAAAYDQIPATGHRPFRDPAAVVWLAQRCQRFITTIAE